MGKSEKKSKKDKQEKIEISSHEHQVNDDVFTSLMSKISEQPPKYVDSDEENIDKKEKKSKKVKKSISKDEESSKPEKKKKKSKKSKNDVQYIEKDDEASQNSNVDEQQMINQFSEQYKQTESIVFKPPQTDEYEENLPTEEINQQETPVTNLTEAQNPPLDYNQLTDDQKLSRKERRQIYNKAQREKSKQPQEIDFESPTIFVGNLNHSIDKYVLQEMFAQYGIIQGSRILMDNNGVSRGVGFVDFDTPFSAQNATEKNGEVIQGRKIKVDIATRKNKD